nr:MAG TPA: hypothetical protein [Caudoviricetes sp.]
MYLLIDILLFDKLKKNSKIKEDATVTCPLLLYFKLVQIL